MTVILVQGQLPLEGEAPNSYHKTKYYLNNWNDISLGVHFRVVLYGYFS